MNAYSKLKPGSYWTPLHPQDRGAESQGRTGHRKYRYRFLENATSPSARSLQQLQASGLTYVYVSGKNLAFLYCFAKNSFPF